VTTTGRPAQLINRCAELGITLTVADGVLHVDAPGLPYMDAFLEELANHKTAILDALTPSQNPHNPQNRTPPSIRDLDDPRPDLSLDTQYWRSLLHHAALADDADAVDGAFGALHGVRCCGARIRPQPSGVLGIEARDDYLGDWGVDRQRRLTPHRSELIRWLRAILDAEDEAAQNALRKTIWPVDLHYEDRPVEEGWRP